jgi:hypothetical protein
MPKYATRVVLQMTADPAVYVELEREQFEYAGPVALAGGGPSQEQKQAASAQRNLSDQEAASGALRDTREQDQYNTVKPFLYSRLMSGDPYTGLRLDQAGGLNARSYQPAFAGLNRNLSSFGSALPSGFATQARTDLASQQARDYDSQLQGALGQDEQARLNAVAGITGQQQIANPAAFYGLANQGNNSIMQAPLQSPGLAGVLGGVASSAFGAAGKSGGFGSLFGCWIAEALYGANDPRTHLVRLWLNLEFRKRRMGRVVMALYLRFGQRVATRAQRSRALRAALRPWFEWALRRARKWVGE